jgi:hypothetical protein
MEIFMVISAHYNALQIELDRLDSDHHSSGFVM